MLERGSSKLAQQSALQEPSIRAESKPSLLDCGLAPTRLVTRSTNASAVSEANGTTVRVSLDLGVRFRYSRLKEAGRGCGGRGVLWELNRCLLGSHCRKRSYATSPLLMLIDILLLSSSEVIVT